MDIETDEAAFMRQAHNYVQQWGCTSDGDAFSTHSSTLWPVMRNGIPLMLKLVKPDSDEMDAGDVLSYFSGNGAIRLIEEDGCAQLLERAIPGEGVSSLEEMVITGRDDEAIHIICDVIEKLHFVPGNRRKPRVLIPFQNRVEGIKFHIKEGRVKNRDLPLISRAYDLSDQFALEAGDEKAVLHGDLHHFNLLHDRERGWLAIDPKGITAPRVYEYASAMCNPGSRPDIIADKKRMDRRAAIIAERSGLDRKTILRFTFLHASQVAAWSLDDATENSSLACAYTAAELAEIRF